MLTVESLNFAGFILNKLFMSGVVGYDSYNFQEERPRDSPFMIHLFSCLLG